MMGPLSEVSMVEAIKRVLEFHAIPAAGESWDVRVIPNPSLPGSALVEVTRPNGIVDAYSLVVVALP